MIIRSVLLTENPDVDEKIESEREASAADKTAAASSAAIPLSGEGGNAFEINRKRVKSFDSCSTAEKNERSLDSCTDPCKQPVQTPVPPQLRAHYA